MYVIYQKGHSPSVLPQWWDESLYSWWPSPEKATRYQTLDAAFGTARRLEPAGKVEIRLLMVGEAEYAKYLASRALEEGPEGTCESLERCAEMLDTYAPDLYPANEFGQITFSRAMMEATSGEIRAFIKNSR